MPPSYAWKFSIKEFFWSTKVFSNEIFQYSETKIPTENRDTPPPPYPNFFDTRNYCNNKRFPYKIFRHWDKKFSTENLDTPPPPPSFIQIFSGPEVSETLKDSPTKFFGTVRQKFRLEIVICPLLSINFFRYQKISGKQKGSFTKLLVSVMWDKKFRQNRDAPLLCMKIFDKRIFLKHQSVLQWNISIQWDKNSDGKSWYSPPLIQTFSIPEIIATINDSPTKFFGTETKTPTENRDTPPPLIQTFSIPEIIATVKDSPTKIFGTETRNFRRKILIQPPLLLSKFFRDQKLVKH